MHYKTNPMAQAWLTAASDLHIRVQHPFTFATSTGATATTQGVFLPDFGSPAGTLLLCRFDDDDVDELAEDTRFFLSAINPQYYEPYRRDLYIETLNDWGWFGSASARPSWFTGSPWTDQRHRTPGVNAMSNKTSKKVPKKPAAKRVTTKPKLLSGGNPQIAKGEGEAPVRAYIAAIPGWKREVGRWLDALIVRTVPNVRKAVKWNSPFYGVEGQGWFLNFHCLTMYIKVAFFRGTSLRPVPPGESKHKEVRYLDIHEDERLDEELVARWIRQASELPGWVP
jgi:hypothetical protein